MTGMLDSILKEIQQWTIQSQFDFSWLRQFSLYLNHFAKIKYIMYIKFTIIAFFCNNAGRPFICQS